MSKAYLFLLPWACRVFLAKRDQNKWKKKLNTDVCGRQIRASSAPGSANNVDEVKVESKIERGRPFDFWGGGGGWGDVWFQKIISGRQILREKNYCKKIPGWKKILFHCMSSLPRRLFKGARISPLPKKKHTKLQFVICLILSSL